MSQVPHPNIIGTCREKCKPLMTQQELANVLGVKRQTINSWEGSGVPSEHRMLRLIQVFVERGVISSYTEAVDFWKVSGRQEWCVPAELAEFFDAPHQQNSTILDANQIDQELPDVQKVDADTDTADATANVNHQNPQPLPLPQVSRKQRVIVATSIFIVLALVGTGVFWPGHTQEVRVTVLASKFWNAVPLDFAPGDTVSVVYDSGTWNINDSNSADIATDANGYGMIKQPYNLLPDAPTSALIGSFLNGRPFAIGNARTFRATEERLMLGINDGNCGSCYGDNTGSIDVRVSVQRANPLQWLLNFLFHL